MAKLANLILLVTFVLLGVIMAGAALAEDVADSATRSESTTGLYPGAPSETTALETSTFKRNIDVYPGSSESSSDNRDTVSPSYTGRNAQGQVDHVNGGLYGGWQ